jgi:putative tryptophan/tyrosine transport system substrate-binding protein
MRRREFIAGVASAAAWPELARAQQPGLSVVGWLTQNAADARRESAFRQGLIVTGFTEGRNVAIDFRSAEGDVARLPLMVRELVNRPVTVIAGINSTAGALAAKAATTTIPIVFVIGGDPVKYGLVASLNRPGGNLTGVSLMLNDLGPKRLELMHDLVPGETKISALVNPTNPNAKSDTDDLLKAAHSMGLSVEVFSASSEREIDRVFAMLAARPASPLFVMSDSWLCAPKARNTCGGRIHPESCRLIWKLTSGSAG